MLRLEVRQQVLVVQRPEAAVAAAEATVVDVRGGVLDGALSVAERLLRALHACVVAALIAAAVVAATGARSQHRLSLLVAVVIVMTESKRCGQIK